MIYSDAPVFGYFGAPARNAAIAGLQRALQALALRTNDRALAVKEDGIIGPATVRATNVAMAQYARAPARLATGKLTQAQVVANAAALTAAITAAARAVAVAKVAPAAAPPVARAAAQASRPTATRAQIAAMQNALRNLGARTNDRALNIAADGAVGPRTRTAVAHAVNRYNVKSPTGGAPTGPQLQQAAVVTALTAAINERAAGISKPVPAAPSKPTRSPTVERLQRALAALGRVRKDKVLQGIKADGVAGPATANAVARALRERLTPAQVTANAEVLARRVEALVAQAGAKPPPKPADAPSGKTKRNPQVAEIQQLLVQLAQLRNDDSLAVVVDGIAGPKTAAAVNKVLGSKFSVAQLATNAPRIITQLRARITAAGKAPVAAEPPPAPEPDPQAEAEEPTPAPTRAEAPAALPDAPSSTTPAAATYTPPETPAAPEAPAPVAPAYIPPEAPEAAAPAEAPSAASVPAEYYPPSAPATTPSTLAPVSPDSTAPTPVAPETERELTPAKKPFPWIWVIGGTAAVVGLGATAYLLTRRRSPATMPMVTRPIRTR